MSEARDAVFELSSRISGHLSQMEGVEAVVLGGSWARGEAHPNSDVDIGIYYRSGSPPSIGDLRQLARVLDDHNPEEVLTGFGGWGPWVDGGGWLTIEGRSVDWIYRDLDHVQRTTEECRAGHPTVHYQPGHPHGFHTHIYLGEIHYCYPLDDPRGTLRSLKRLVDPYPPLLKQALIQRQLWEAGFALDTCRKPAARGDAFYVAGSLFRFAACLVQTLFALNERYVINEKGSVEAAGSLSVGPPGFAGIIGSVLAHPGERADQLQVSIERCEKLLASVKALSNN